MLRTAVDAIQQTIAKAKKINAHCALVELDEGEGRRLRIVPASYTLSDEFEAFAGEVIFTTENIE